MPDYNGYFLKVSLANGTTAMVRDYDLNDLLATKGALITASGTPADNGIARLMAIPANPEDEGKVLQLNNGLPSWASASAASGVNDADLYIQLNNGTATKLFSANSANAATLSFAEGTTNGAIAISDGSSTVNIPIHGLGDAAYTSITNLENTLVSDDFAKKSDIGDANLVLSLNGVTSTLFTANTTVPSSLSFAEGSTNGAIAVNGTAILVHGLGSAAYAETSDFDEAGTAATAEQNAKDYADNLIAGLGSVMEVKGTTTTVPTSTTGNETGDVWIISNPSNPDDEHNGEEYVWTGEAWEMMGKNNIDLSEYTKTEDLGALALKDSVSVPANTFVTGISATTAVENISAINQSVYSLTAYTPGSDAQLVVTDGVLSLSGGVAPIITRTQVNPASITITHNTYSAIKNSAVIPLTLS